MRRLVPAAVLAGALAFALPLAATAQPAPPPGALPASEVLRMVEQQPDFAHLHEFEWDNDGYWEVEFVTRDGTRRKLRLDPISGQPRPR